MLGDKPVIWYQVNTRAVRWLKTMVNFSFEVGQSILPQARLMPHTSCEDHFNNVHVKLEAKHGRDGFLPAGLGIKSISQAMAA
jgi:hypothetical protein